MSIVILCGIYLAELACYQLGIRILFEARQKTKLWMMIGILFPSPASDAHTGDFS